MLRVPRCKWAINFLLRCITMLMVDNRTSLNKIWWYGEGWKELPTTVCTICALILIIFKIKIRVSTLLIGINSAIKLLQSLYSKILPCGLVLLEEDLLVFWSFYSSFNEPWSKIWSPNTIILLNPLSLQFALTSISSYLLCPF